MSQQIQRESQYAQQLIQTIYRHLGMQRKPKVVKKLIEFLEQCKTLQQNLIKHVQSIQEQEKLWKLQQQNAKYLQGIAKCKEMKPILQQRIQKAKQQIGGINEKISNIALQLELQQNCRQINEQVKALQEKYREMKQREQQMKKSIMKDLDYARKVDVQQITVKTGQLERLIYDLQRKKIELQELLMDQTQKKKRIERDIMNFQDEKHQKTVKHKQNKLRRNFQNELQRQYPDYSIIYNIHPQQKQIVQEIKRKVTFQQQWQRVQGWVILLVVFSIIVFILK